MANKALLLGALFGQVNEVLQRFAKDPRWRLQGRIGFLAVLHTWSQTLMDHFHLHCLVPAGVLRTDEQRWVAARKKYLFRSKSMAKAFKHRYRDRSDNDQKKSMTLDAVEFIRRFLLHVLPDGFVKIRYFGFIAHRNRKKSITLIRKLIDSAAKVEIRQETVIEMMIRVAGIDITLCPKCGKGRFKLGPPLAKTLPPRAKAPT